jgi:hypothetical protein
MKRGEDGVEPSFRLLEVVALIGFETSRGRHVVWDCTALFPKPWSCREEEWVAES